MMLFELMKSLSLISTYLDGLQEAILSVPFHPLGPLFFSKSHNPKPRTNHVNLWWISIKFPIPNLNLLKTFFWDIIFDQLNHSFDLDVRTKYIGHW